MRPPCSSVLAEMPDFTIEEPHGLGFGDGEVSCFPACHRLTREKKIGQENEQDSRMRSSGGGCWTWITASEKSRLMCLGTGMPAPRLRRRQRTTP